MSYVEISLVFFLSIFLGVFIAYSKYGIRSVFLCPFAIYTFYFSAVYLLVPILQNVFSVGRFNHLIKDNHSTLIYSISFCFLYYISSFIGFYCFGKINCMKNLHSKFKNFEEDKSILVPLLVFIFIGSCFVFVYNFRDILIYNYTYFMRDRTTLLSGYGYITKGMTLSVPVIMLLIVKYLKIKNNKTIKIIFIGFLVALTTIFNLLLGSRLIAIIPLVYIYFIYYVLTAGEGRFLKRLTIGVSVFVFCFFLVSYLGNVRKNILAGNISFYNKTEGVLNSIIDEVSTSFGHSELFAFVVDKGGDFNYSYGTTYLAALTMPIPRFLWLDKPVGGGPVLANLVRPGAWVLGQEGNSSFTTGAPLEAYLNFGLAGVLTVGFLHGCLIGFLSRSITFVKTEVGLVVFFISVFALTEMFVIGEFLGVISRYLFMCLPFVLFKKLQNPARRGCLK